jgi:multicomponent Na+:H+ antiporter subunit G
MDLEMVQNALSWFFLGTGSVVLVISSFGVLRLPDYYSRIHAASVTDTLGAGLIVLGLVFQTELGLATGKLLMILLFLAVTGPATTHALARAAKAHDLDLPSFREAGQDGGETS